MALIALFGLLGVLSRYFVDRLFGQIVLIEFPVSTFVVNCTGSFLIGIVFVVGAERALISRELSMALSVGFLGGFTTFSAYTLQSVQLIERKQFITAATYLIGAPVFGLAAVFIGIATARYYFVR